VNLADHLDGRTNALTVADVAELLNISERQVYKPAAENRIPSFKIGGSVRFDPAAFAVRRRIGPKLSQAEEAGRRAQAVPRHKEEAGRSMPPQKRVAAIGPRGRTASGNAIEVRVKRKNGSRKRCAAKHNRWSGGTRRRCSRH